MQTLSRTFDKPDEVRRFGHGHADFVDLSGSPMQQATFEPGWKWSDDMKPIAGTDTCQGHHIGYVLAGSMHIESDDGSGCDMHAGDVFNIAPGHDAWVTSDEACVLLDWGPASAGYAKAGG